MTGLELLLVGLLVAAGIAIAGLLRRRPDGQAVIRAEIARLADALARGTADERELRGDVGRVRQMVEGLRAAAAARARAEETGWETIGRLEAVMLGSGARGRHAENLLDEALSQLPAGMLERDFSVGGKRVEFALVLPDGRRLPVDSKWTAARELQALQEEEAPPGRELLRRRVEEEVTRRAREVAGYLDPSLTTPFAVACIPDAAFAVCRKAHAESFARGVVLAPYSTALPVLLALYALASRHGSAGDVLACLAELEGLVAAMARTLENKVARATTTLQNATDEWRTYVGKARGALARGRGGSLGPPPSSSEGLPRLHPAPDDRMPGPPLERSLGG